MIHSVKCQFPAISYDAKFLVHPIALDMALRFPYQDSYLLCRKRLDQLSQQRRTNFTEESQKIIDRTNKILIVIMAKRIFFCRYVTITPDINTDITKYNIL